MHRKGASPSDEGLIIIPGSRGDNSYIVKPTGDGVDNLFSLAHGAGRAISRSEAKEKMFRKYKNSDMTKTKFQSKVICGDKDLLFEEAPEAYKNIENVVADLVSFGLCKIIAVMKPVATFKTSVKINQEIISERISKDIERKNARKWKEKQKWL
jgi:release factor H-coupled RctB family protein